MGTDPDTGQPITTTEWIDRLAPKALAVVGAGTCATYGGIHAMDGNPTGAMGLADYLGWNWKSKAGLPIVNVPGCPVQPDNFMETLLYLLYQVAGLRSDDSARRAAAPDVAVRQRRFMKAATAAAITSRPIRDRLRNSEMPGEARLLGAGGELQRHQTRMDGRESAVARMSAGSASAARCPGFPTNSCRSWTSRPARDFRPPHREFTAGRSERCATSPNRPSNKEPKWRHTGTELTTGYRPTTYGNAKSSLQNGQKGIHEHD